MVDGTRMSSLFYNFFFIKKFSFVSGIGDPTIDTNGPNVQSMNVDFDTRRKFQENTKMNQVSYCDFASVKHDSQEQLLQRYLVPINASM